MKITEKIISIPPYISTSWDKIASLHKANEYLIITLNDATQVSIPHLSDETIQQLFAAHASFLEHQAPIKSTVAPKSANTVVDQLFSSPLKLVFGTIDSLTQALQHNPAYSNLPTLPQEITERLTQLAQMLAPEDVRVMPDPVEHCNCMYCQMMRIIKGSSSQKSEDHPDHPSLEKDQEQISDEELRFEEWQITSLADKMYLVTNKLDPNEQYTVFLGDPVGCTCGKAHCEHIVAVLRH